MTRRGHAVLVGLGLLLATLVAAAGASASQATGMGGTGGPAEPTGGRDNPAVAVVQPGDTLWSVASRHVPDRDLPGMIEEIRRLNGLDGHTIHPGQELILPSR